MTFIKHPMRAGLALLMIQRHSHNLLDRGFLLQKEILRTNMFIKMAAMDKIFGSPSSSVVSNPLINQ